MGASGRTVGAALRGRPWLNPPDSKNDGLGFGEHDFKPRAATEGRPLQYVRWRLMNSKSRCFRKGLLLLIILAFARTTIAHEGPPFPLFVDQKVDRYVVSVWTDPDVGTALFFVIVNAENLPPDLHVQIGVQPVSGRLAEVFYPAERENVQGRDQYKSQVQFDAQELWRVRVQLQSTQSGNAETVATVEATPPGYGRWDLLIYLVPFLAVGLLWAMAMIRKVRQRTGDT